MRYLQQCTLNPGNGKYAAAVPSKPPARPLAVRWPWALRRTFAGLREIVETVQYKLLTTCGLAQHRPHALAGLRARRAAAVTLHNFCC
ncbi:MAG TPA: hypothetical protein VKT52_04505 [Ktedonobacterales bacterium]|nr:hypothetical protein [Ktedonobacterales bacterium]